MFIIDVIPLLRLPRHLPQTFTYFSSQKLEAGVLVMIKIRSKETPAVVINSDEAVNRRIEIKHTDFELKPINKIISAYPVFTKNQIKLGLWLAKYYLEPLSLVFKTIAPALPKKLIGEPDFSSAANTENPATSKKRPLLLKSDNIGVSLNFLENEMKEALDRSRQILILAPETMAAQKIFTLISNKFPEEKIAYLGKKPVKNKFWEYCKKIASKEAKITIGVRLSALLPFSNLGLIILSDENSDSHKQWEGHPLYDARDIAQKLSEIFGAKLVLESKAPSISSFYKAKNGAYDFCSPLKEMDHLPPSVKITDMRLEQRKGNYSVFSEELLEKLKIIIKNKKRALLFVNRRGAANFVVCKNCGDIAKCPLCQIPLIYYPEIRALSGGVNYERLICNHCNFNAPPQSICSRCRGTEIKYLGLGTQKIEKQLKNEFPYINILRLDSDAAKKETDKEKILASFEGKTPAVMIATQQIFGAEKIPEISFIGAISLDAMLAIPDFRTNERVFRSVLDLAEISKDILIQTYNPKNPVIKTLPKLDYGALFEKEIEDRRLLFYPPFSEITKLNYRNLKPEIAKKEALSLAYLLREKLKEQIGRKMVKILGPAPRFIFQEKGFYNWHIIFKIGAGNPEISEKIKKQIEKIIRHPADWEIDVNPESLL